MVGRVTEEIVPLSGKISIYVGTAQLRHMLLEGNNYDLSSHVMPTFRLENNVKIDAQLIVVCTALWIMSEASSVRFTFCSI